MLLAPIHLLAAGLEDLPRTSGADRYRTDLSFWQARAERGDANAQYKLGFLFANGHGVPRDDSQALRWYREVAEKGYVSAQFRLATMYAAGQGTSTDYSEAAKWYGKAAAHGDARAQYQLATLHADGRGVPQDPVKALKWYRQAAAQGDNQAQMKIVRTYLQGQPPPTGSPEANLWLRKAAETSDAETRAALTELLRGKSRRITSPRANVRTRPTTQSRIIIQLTAGDTVYPMGRSDAWVETYVPAYNTTGWVHRSLLGKPTDGTKGLRQPVIPNTVVERFAKRVRH